MYYEMKKHAEDYGISIPPKLRKFRKVNGWCAMSVDELADRLVPIKFKNDVFGMEEIYSMNNKDVLFDSAILSSLICSCSFIYIYKIYDEIKLQVVDGHDATGTIDESTRLLTEGYAVLERDENNEPVVEAYFSPTETIYYEKDKNPYSVPNPTGYPLLVPIVYRPDAKRPFGHSRISRSMMGYQDEVTRTLKRLSVSEEYYSVPQKYAVGLDEDFEIDKWNASMSAFLTITGGDGSSKPTLGQFQQQNIAPFMDSIKTQASLFAGETGLTLDDLGFPTANPASDDAIKLQHARLVRTAKKAQRTFSTGFINAGFVASCLANNESFTRDRIKDTSILWEPLFEPGASTISAIGDGLIKINTVQPDYVNDEQIYQLTGIKGADM